MHNCRAPFSTASFLSKSISVKVSRVRLIGCFQELLMDPSELRRANLFIFCLLHGMNNSSCTSLAVQSRPPRVCSIEYQSAPRYPTYQQRDTSRLFAQNTLRSNHIWTNWKGRKLNRRSPRFQSYGNAQLKRHMRWRTN